MPLKCVWINYCIRCSCMACYTQRDWQHTKCGYYTVGQKEYTNDEGYTLTISLQ